jgi:hypothetical protein
MAMPARYITMLVLLLALDAWGKVAVDLSEYKTDCAVKIRQEKEGLVAKWNTRQGEAAMTFSLEAGSPLFAKMEMAGKALASKIDPQFVVICRDHRLAQGAAGESLHLLRQPGHAGIGAACGEAGIGRREGEEQWGSGDADVFRALGRSVFGRAARASL